VLGPLTFGSCSEHKGMQLNVTLYKFICIIINTFASREIGYDFSGMVSHMECNWWWLLYLCVKKVSLKHGYDITEVCCLLNIFCFVVTKLQTLITICSAFYHQSVWFAWLFFMPYTRGAAKYQPSSVLCQMACHIACYTNTLWMSYLKAVIFMFIYYWVLQNLSVFWC
jgi:hypothetical protein